VVRYELERQEFSVFCILKQHTHNCKQRATWRLLPIWGYACLPRRLSTIADLFCWNRRQTRWCLLFGYANAASYVSRWRIDVW